MTMPRQGGGKQTYGTPSALLDAVECRFGEIAVDLACDESNAVCPVGYTEMVDSLAQDWTHLRGVLWCNPPFAHIAPWASKCAASAGGARLIILLTPASIGSRWFIDHVHGRALVLALAPRLTFAGCDTPYPKDCMLSVFGASVRAGFDVWEWRS